MIHQYQHPKITASGVFEMSKVGNIYVEVVSRAQALASLPRLKDSLSQGEDDVMMGTETLLDPSMT